MDVAAVSNAHRATGEIEGKPALVSANPREPLDDRLRAAYTECARTTRARARNFYHGLRLTPEPRRSAIYSIYTWMRAADDLADAPESAEHRRRSLRRFREQAERVLAGSTPDADAPSFWWAFRETAASYSIDHDIFRHMLDGLDDDLETVWFRDDRQLTQYCYRVAGTAGLACLWIWGLRAGADAARARELALHRGQAFQRTNILRDFAQDHDSTPSRVYIPSNAFARHGVTPAEVRAWSKPEGCQALVLEQARVAREHYAASDGLESMIDPACSPTLWAMTRIYSGILELVERDPERVANDRRIRLAGAKKASIALGAALWAKVGRW